MGRYAHRFYDPFCLGFSKDFPCAGSISEIIHRCYFVKQENIYDIAVKFASRFFDRKLHRARVRIETFAGDDRGVRFTARHPADPVKSGPQKTVCVVILGRVEEGHAFPVSVYDQLRSFFQGQIHLRCSHGEDTKTYPRYLNTAVSQYHFSHLAVSFPETVSKPLLFVDFNIHLE